MPAIETVPNRVAAAVRRSFRQFLALPLATIVGFVGLNALVYLADRSWSGGAAPMGFRWLGELLGDRAALGSLLTTVASSIITVTSITFSLLLIAVQQGAASLTAQVTDQFMARRTNQFYFGYFVGLSVFVLMTLVTNTEFHRPVFGTSLALVMTTFALCLVIVMLYNTIDQMRPERIVQFIHEQILKARADDERLLARTRRTPRPGWSARAVVRATERGYVVGLDPDRIEAAVAQAAPDAVEVLMRVPVGTFRALGDPLFDIRARPGFLLEAQARAAIEAACLRALTFDDGRDSGHDAGYGLHQLATIAWTSVSTAKSNPSPGRVVLLALRDVVARWSPGELHPPEAPDARVILADHAPTAVTDALEAVIVVASESIQCQTLAEAMDSLAILLGHVAAPTAERLADIAHRSLSALGEHVLTRELEASLHDLAAALSARGFDEGAAAVASATRALAGSLGTLNARSTRVPGTTG